METTQHRVLWDRPKLARFRRAYRAAVAAAAPTFRFDGNEFVVGYAKYLIEYLESVLSASRQ